MANSNLRKGNVVWVKGDSSVGMPGYWAMVLQVNKGYVVVKDKKDGSVDEVSKEQVVKKTVVDYMSTNPGRGERR